MPWYVIDVKKLDARAKGQLFSLRRTDMTSHYHLADCFGKGKVEKPTEIPEGMSLKWFPTDTDMTNQRYKREAQLMEGLETGEYARVPWMDGLDDQPAPRWATTIPMQNAWQPLLTKAGKIEYFPSCQHWHENRPQVTTIGRFLRLVWASLDAGWDNHATDRYGPITDDMIRVWSELPKSLTKDDIQFKTTPDEIEEAYLHGPSSCMSKTVESYATKTHPSRVYGAGDLAIAVLPKRRGPGYGQRALVWPEKKVYARIYGTGPLEQFLKDLGYAKGDFHGAKLLKIKDGENYVLPYIDWHDFVVERRDHLRIWHKQIAHECVPNIKIQSVPHTQRQVWAGAASTSGVVPPRRVCDGCQNPIPIREHLQGYTTCKACLKNQVECNGCGLRKRKDTVGWRFMASTYNLKAWLSKRVLFKHRWELMKYCGERRCIERMNYTLRNHDDEYFEVTFD